ncbi:MAG: glycoside hydrolase family 2 protein, partial [Agrobacterium albertimagni]
PGRYSDNAFDLSVGESRRIIFTPDTPLAAGTVPDFRIYDLYTCQSVD